MCKQIKLNIKHRTTFQFDSKDNKNEQLSNDSISPKLRAAHELIASIWAEINCTTRPISKIILNEKQYSLLQWYRTQLGDLSNPDMEYVSRYKIFGLDICLESIKDNSNIDFMDKNRSQIKLI